MGVSERVGQKIKELRKMRKRKEEIESLQRPLQAFEQNELDELEFQLGYKSRLRTVERKSLIFRRDVF